MFVCRRLNGMCQIECFTSYSVDWQTDRSMGCRGGEGQSGYAWRKIATISYSNGVVEVCLKPLPVFWGGVGVLCSSLIYSRFSPSAIALIHGR